MSYTRGELISPTQSKRKRSEFVAYLMTTLGGGNAGVQGAFLSYDHRSAYDNANELEQLASRYQEHRVQKFPLGLSETIESMYENSGTPVEEMLCTIANSNSRNGLSARAAFGGQAGHLLASTTEHQQQILAIRDLATIAKEGHLHALIHDFLIGLSGGTAPGAMITLIEAYERLYASLGIAVEIRIHAIGYFGLIGASDSGRLNDPCARAAMIAYVTSKAPPLIVRSLRLFEQPSLGPSAALQRTRFNTLYYQAIQSEDIRKHLELIESNDATTSPLGNISFRHIDIIQNPGSIDALRANAASQMLSVFEHAVAKPNANPSIFENEMWLTRSFRVRNIDIDVLMHRHWVNSSLLIQEATSRLEEHEPSLIVDDPEFGRIDTSLIDHRMQEPISSGEDLKRRILILVTLRQLLSVRVQELERNEPAVLALIQRGTKQLQSKVKKAARTKSIPGRQKLIAQIRIVLTEVRRLGDMRFLIEDKLRRLRYAQQLTSDMQADLQNVISNVKESLNECLSDLGPQSLKGLVATPSVSWALVDLLALRALPKDQRISRLDKLAPVITKRGLKEIVNSQYASIESITDAIVYGKPTYSSPSLGGKPYDYGGPTLYILPNVEQEDAVLLEQAILSRDATALISFTENNDCGAAIVKLKIRNFDTVQSLFPGELANNLARALSSKNALMRFPSGMACLEHLGIRFDPNSGSIHFDKDEPLRN